MTKLEQEIRELHRTGQPFVLVSVTAGSGSMPRHAGARMLVRANGDTEGSIGGGALEANAVRQALRVFETKTDVEMPFALTSEEAARSDMICGGSGTLTFAYYPPERPVGGLMEDSGMLYIFGGGHVGRALAQAAGLVELPVRVFDDREEYANPERFPHAVCTVLESYAAIPELLIEEKDMLAIVTRGHLGDADVLRWALRQKAGYIGMIGSIRKRDMLYRRMEAEGFSREQLARVHSPIGLDIGAETAEEIAVSILAELIAERARRRKEEDE